jgi:hypothetical protein
VKYSRVLTVLALMGVVALAATLMTRSAEPVRKPVRAAAMPTNQLHGMLKQVLQQFLVAQRIRTRPIIRGAVQPNGQTCYVNQCSLKPCAQFVQSGSAAPTTAPADLAVQTVVARPPLANRPTCIRRANSQAQWVNSQTASAQLMPSVPVSASSPRGSAP